MQSIKLYLLGYKGLKVLSEIISEFGSDLINSVVLARDNNIENDYFFELKKICVSNSIKFVTRDEKDSPFSGYSFAVGWRWLINNAPQDKLIILHDSLLPKYRGFNPLVSALINGDTKVGVTALFANEKYDTGDIIYQSDLEIKYPARINEVVQNISENYSILINKIIKDIINNKPLPRKKQDSKKATYSLWRDREDYVIEWNWEASKIRRHIDAVGYPYLGAITTINGEEISILEAEEIDDLKIINRTPGKVIFFDNGYPVIVCGKGLLKLIIMKNKNGEDFTLKKFRSRFK